MMKTLRVLAVALVAVVVGWAPAQANPAAANPKLVSAIYVDRLSGLSASDPHYFFLMTVNGSKVHGKLGFEYQDGSIGIVHRFKGSRHNGLLTLHFSNHKTLTGTIGSRKKFEVDNCHRVMKYTTARFPDCQFHKAKHFYS